MAIMNPQLQKSDGVFQLNTSKRLKNFSRQVFVVGLLLVVSGCAFLDERPLGHYVVGISTPAGNKIWADGVDLDDSWGVPGGSLSCCWESTLSTASVFNRPMPKKLVVTWLELATNIRYEATVMLDKDSNRIARHLPGYAYVDPEGKEPDEKAAPYPTLIVGMAPGGHVTVWLSNVVAEDNTKGRVLHILGQTQAHGELEPPAVTK